MQADWMLRRLGVGNAATHDLGNAAAFLENARGLPVVLLDCGPAVVPACTDQYVCLPEALFVRDKGVRVAETGVGYRLAPSIALRLRQVV